MKRHFSIWVVPTFTLTAAAQTPTPTATFWNLEGERNQYDGMVWLTSLPGDWTGFAYSEPVEKLFAAFEAKTARQLGPGPKRRVGIKIYTLSGPGIDTPKELTRAVIANLKRRGFTSEEIFILGATTADLRAAGYLPPLSRQAEGPYFEGTRVYALDQDELIDPVWYYESALPRESGLGFLSAELVVRYRTEEDANDRKSFLAAPLLTEVDFWINLPMIMDHPAAGLSGALTNASLWNVTNRDRFLASPANAAVAAAEIAAIPELLNNWAFTIVSLEQAQFIGGPMFNANYVRRDPRLVMSIDPVALDVWLVDLLNTWREEAGFRPLPNPLPMLQNASILGVGRRFPDRVLTVD